MSVESSVGADRASMAEGRTPAPPMVQRRTEERPMLDCRQAGQPQGPEPALRDLGRTLQ